MSAHLAQTKFGSAFCNDGDAVLAVRWLARDESDAKRRTFDDPDQEEAGSVIPVNSTKLRHAGFGLTVLELSISTACSCNAELESDVEHGDVDGEDDWEDADDESDEVLDDRAEGDSPYVHGRRLVLSVADEQTALDRCW
jgi:hypothetical protein